MRKILSKLRIRWAIVKLLKNNKGPMDPGELPSLLNINEGKTEEALMGLMEKGRIFHDENGQLVLKKTLWSYWFYWIREQFLTIKGVIWPSTGI